MANQFGIEMTETTMKTTSDQTDFGNYVSLLKPRVMSLVVFTAAVGLVVAPGSMNLVLAFASVLFIALGAGASGSLNMWWDADIDRIMKRTQDRPVPSGCLLYTSPSPRDATLSRMPSSA